MPQSHGKQKRAQKQKKRRQERHKNRSARQSGARAAAHETASAVAPDALAAFGYDPERELVAAEWAALSQQERLDCVTRYHEGTLRPGERPPSTARHGGLHVLVESQLASGEPPEARVALRRLRAEGMKRHDAIHAIGWVATDHARRAMESKQPLDDAAYARDLEALTIQRWLAMAGVGS